MVAANPRRRSALALIAAFAAAPIAAGAQDVPPPSAPPIEQAPADALVRIRAVATYEARPEEPALTYVAKIFVNGAAAGKTPYEARFAPGRYSVDVESDGQRATTELEVVAGKTYNVKARFYIPMTAQEKRARQEAELARLKAEKEAAEVVWRQAHDTWEREDAAARKRRRPYVIAGSVLLVAGAGLAIGGAVAEAKAQDEQDKYVAQRDAWAAAAAPEDIDYWEQQMADSADARDKDNGMGIAFLAVGGAAIVGGIVALALLPRRPPEPERGDGDERGAELAVLPSGGPGAAGLTLRGEF
jgi:hypothetical protein